ncbi:MAG: hypothetical protein AAFQ87_16660 [Bacteroidota bacterium]
MYNLTVFVCLITCLSFGQIQAQEYNKGRNPREVVDDVYAGRVDENEEPKQSLAEDMCECFANQDWAPLQSNDLISDYTKIKGLLRAINRCEMLVTVERPGYDFNFKNRDSVLAIAKQLCTDEYQKITELVSLYIRAHDLKVQVDAEDQDTSFTYEPAFPRSILLTEPKDLSNEFEQRLLTHMNGLANNYRVNALYLGTHERYTCGIKTELTPKSPPVSDIHRQVYQLKGQKSGYMTIMHYLEGNLQYITRSGGPDKDLNVYQMDTLMVYYDNQIAYIKEELGEEKIVGIYLFLRSFDDYLKKSSYLMCVYEGEDGIYQEAFFAEYIKKGSPFHSRSDQGPIAITPSYMSYRTSGGLKRAEHGHREYYFLTPDGDLVGTSNKNGHDITQNRFDGYFLKLY